MKTSSSLLSTLFCLLLLWVVSCKKTEDTPITPGGTTPPGSTTTKSSAKDIKTFTFAALSPAVTATIDATAKAISATVASGTDVTKLVPTITLSDKATVSPVTGVAQDFSKAVTYTVTAEDGTTQAYIATVTKAGTNTSSSSTCLLATVRYETISGYGLGNTYREVTFEHDANQRIMKRVITNSDSPEIETTTYTYDSNGFLTQINQDLANATTYAIFSRKISYTYQNARLVKMVDAITYPNQTTSNWVETTTYEYESATGLDLSKKTVERIGLGSGFDPAYFFKNGRLTAYVVKNLGTYTINEKGQLVSYTTSFDKYNNQYSYDADGQLLKYLSYNTNGKLTTDKSFQYTTIPNKDYGMADGQSDVTKYYGNSDAVINPVGFKGFPPLGRVNLGDYTDPENSSKYLLQTSREIAYYNDGSSETNVATMAHKLNANGLVASYVQTISWRPKDIYNIIFTYKGCN